MRCPLVLCCVLLAAPTARAVPSGVDRHPAVTPLGPQEAQAFAAQLKTAIDLMAKQYTRPVQRPDLVTAALRGLYQAAGKSLPASLPAAVNRADGDEERLADLIAQARQRLGNPASLQGTRALQAGLWGALKALDPYCFLTVGESYAQSTATEGTGAGLELEEGGAGPLRVKSVVPGGPAQKAGLRPGDVLARLDGQPLDRKTAAEALELWRNLAERGHRERFGVVVRRPGRKEPFRTTVAPGSYTINTVFGVSRNDDNTWNYYLDRKRKIAHVRLEGLKQGTAAELGRVLAELHKEGARGLVLDLRWCPGGLLDEAVDAASLFVGDRTIATINYRDGRRMTCVRRYGGQGVGGTYLDLPLVVLVGGATRGGGELIAASVQDAKRGAVVGRRTVGKGSVQNALKDERGMIFTPAPDLTVRLSVGVFVRAGGKNLQRFAASKPSDDWGVRPDAGLEFPVSRALDRQLGAWYQLQNLRPGTSDEALPLDDPDNDAPLRFALKVLARRMEKQRAAR